MRDFIYLLLVVALPTALFSTSSDAAGSSYLTGNYYDSYSRTEIQISKQRRGINARINNGRWRTYDYVGNGVYDDCYGRVIVDLGYGDIKYVEGRSRNGLVLSKNQNNYGQNSYNSYGNNSSYKYDVSPYCGTWGSYNSSSRLYIEAHGSGFRARNNRGAWSYYSGHRDGSFRDRNGNRYHFDNRRLTWSSASGKRRIQFNRY